MGKVPTVVSENTRFAGRTQRLPLFYQGCPNMLCHGSFATDNATQSLQSGARPSVGSAQCSKNHRALERESFECQVVITTRSRGSSGKRSRSNRSCTLSQSGPHTQKYAMPRSSNSFAVLRISSSLIEVASRARKRQYLAEMESRADGTSCRKCTLPTQKLRVGCSLSCIRPSIGLSMGVIHGQW